MKSARRGFLKALAGAPLLTGETLLAQTPGPAPTPAAPATAGPAAATALADAAERLLGGSFAGIARDEVVKGIEGNLKAADTVKAARALRNSDEPVVSFDPRTSALKTARGVRR
jgi:hypothetical protein